jgi:hypothetical protein
MGQLAQQVRAKYPGAYDDLDDATLEAQILAKHPEYADLAEPKEAPPAWDLTGPVKPAMIGMVKGAAQGAISAGRLIHKIPGVSEGVDALYNLFGVKVDSGHDFGERRLSDEITGPPMSAEERLGADYKSTTERVGGAIEQGLEMAAGSGVARKAAGSLISRGPRLIPNVIADAATGATAAAAHGEDPKMGAAMNALIPVGGALAQGAGGLVKKGAVRLARAGIKPTVTEMKQTAGASRVGINKIANRIAEFIVDNRITTPDKAQAIVDAAEAEIQALVGDQATDAATRSARYLKALENSAAQQGLGASDVATLRNAGKELVEGPMGEDVFSFVGDDLTSTRQLRATVPANEALRSARAASRWSNRKAYGEMKGAATEASKAVERGQRDAVKAAVPTSRPAFAKASQAIKARNVLERKEFREGSRDALGLTTQLIGAGEMLRGKVPMMATVANMIRSGQLQLGVHAGRMADAIKNNDVQTVTEILARLGVSLGADTDQEP